MITGVIFDMDGLMIDTERLSVSGWIYAGKQIGYDIPKELILKTLGLDIKNTKTVFLSYYGNQFAFSKLRDIRNDYVERYIESNGVPIKPGLYDLLEYLGSSNYQYAVATSATKSRVERYFENAGLSNIKNIVTGDMIERGKPEPDIYIKACELINLPPDECIALEDSPMGILSASRAGLKPIMIPDLILLDNETKQLLWSLLPDLYSVKDLLTAQTNGEKI
ncbi:MAG: HAD family phosphatase [Parabacteroides sp.]|nr:HAD family phosphatase [Parabacteroides sp.]